MFKNVPSTIPRLACKQSKAMFDSNANYDQTDLVQKLKNKHKPILKNIACR